MAARALPVLLALLGLLMTAQAFRPAPPRAARSWQLRALPSPKELKDADCMASVDLASSVCTTLRTIQTGGGDITDADRTALRDAVSSMLSHSDGARGFFVRWLTDSFLEDQEEIFDEQLPRELMDALDAAPVDVVSPLMVMNLVMPCAMVLAHQKNGDEPSAAASKATEARAAHLIEELGEGPVREAVEKKLYGALSVLEDGVEGDADEKAFWADFYEKWGYDEDQRQSIRACVGEVLGADEQ